MKKVGHVAQKATRQRLFSFSNTVSELLISLFVCTPWACLGYWTHGKSFKRAVVVLDQEWTSTNSNFIVCMFQ